MIELRSLKSSREAWAALVLFGCILMLQILPYGNLNFVGTFMDGIQYLLMADFLGSSSPSADAVSSFRLSHFPPLYPLVLSWVGAGSDHVARAFWLQSFLFIGSMSLIYAWIRSNAVAWPTAMAVVVLFALSPQFFLCSVRLCSEPLFISLVFGAFICADRDGLTSNRQLAGVLLMALVALSTLARTAGVALILALLVALIVHRVRYSTVAWRLFFVGLPILGWSAFKGASSSGLDYADHMAVNYSVSGMASLWAQLGRQFGGFLMGISPLDAGPLWDSVFFACLGLLAYRVWLDRVRRGCLDALFLPLYAILVVAWPFPHQMGRLCLPITAILLGYAVFAATKTGQIRWRLMVTRSAQIALVVALAQGAFLTIHRTTLSAPEELVAFKKADGFYQAKSAPTALSELESVARIVETLREIPQVVPPGQCTYTLLPQFARFHSAGEFVMLPLAGPHHQCDFLLTTTLVGANQLSLHAAARDLERTALPVLVSAQMIGTETLSVASLSRIRRSATTN